MFFFLFSLSFSVIEDDDKEYYYETPEQPPTAHGFAGQLARQLDKTLQKAQENYPEQFYIINNITETFRTALNESILFPSLNPVKPHVQKAFDICEGIFNSSKKALAEETIDVADEVSNMIKDLELDELAKTFKQVLNSSESLEHIIPERDINESLLVLKNASRSAGVLFRQFARNISMNFKQRLYEAGLRDKEVNFTNQMINKTKYDEANKTLMATNDIIPSALLAVDKLVKASYILIFNETGSLLDLMKEFLGDDLIGDIKELAKDYLKDIENDGQSYEQRKINLRESMDEIKAQAKTAGEALLRTAQDHVQKIGEQITNIIQGAIDGADTFEVSDDEDDFQDKDNRMTMKKLKKAEEEEKKRRRQLSEQLEKAKQEDSLIAHKSHEKGKESLKKKIKKHKGKFKNILKSGLKILREEAKKINSDELINNYRKIKKEEEEAEQFDIEKEKRRFREKDIDQISDDENNEDDSYDEEDGEESNQELKIEEEKANFNKQKLNNEQVRKHHKHA